MEPLSRPGRISKDLASDLDPLVLLSVSIVADYVVISDDPQHLFLNPQPAFSDTPNETFLSPDMRSTIALSAPLELNGQS